MGKTTFDFSPPATRELERMASELSATKATVVRDALSLYGFVIGELKDPGSQLAIVHGNEIAKIIAVPGLLAVAQRGDYTGFVKA